MKCEEVCPKGKVGVCCWDCDTFAKCSHEDICKHDPEKCGNADCTGGIINGNEKLDLSHNDVVFVDGQKLHEYNNRLYLERLTGQKWSVE